MTEQEKSRMAEARRERLEAQSELYREKQRAISAARCTLERLTAANDTTNAQLLEALKMMNEIIQTHY